MFRLPPATSWRSPVCFCISRLKVLSGVSGWREQKGTAVRISFFFFIASNLVWGLLGFMLFPCRAHPDGLFSVDADQKIKVWPLDGLPDPPRRSLQRQSLTWRSCLRKNFSFKIASEGRKRNRVYGKLTNCYCWSSQLRTAQTAEVGLVLCVKWHKLLKPGAIRTTYTAHSSFKVLKVIWFIQWRHWKPVSVP